MAGDPQHQYRLLLRHVPFQTAKFLYYRSNFFRQGAIAEAHSTAALYTFLMQLLTILDNKICTYIHMHFPTWIRSPLEFGSGLEAFKSQMAGFARGSKLRSTVKEGLNKSWWDICFELWSVHCAVPSAHLTCNVHDHLENRNINILLSLLQSEQALPSARLMLCGLFIYLSASEGSNRC